jgi:hypothetical protein
VGFVKENVTLRLVALRVFLYSAASTIAPMPQTDLNLQMDEAGVRVTEVMFFRKSGKIKGNVIGIHSFEMVKKTQAL